MRTGLHGLLVLDKPSGITSRDAVNRIQQRLPRRTKIGHTGTLDPLATGVLVICIGGATRLAEYVQDMDKTYRTTIVLGGRSTTDDADGIITPTTDISVIEEVTIRETLNSFLGSIEQTPPAFSAVKVDGRRAHDLARRGATFEIRARTVRIDRVNILAYAWPNLQLEIACGKGTYIRSLARDLGERLRCGAYVKELRRTSVGPFTAETGMAIDEPDLEKHLLPMAAAVSHLPKIAVDAAATDKLSHGRPITLHEHHAVLAECAIVNETGEMVGIGRIAKHDLLCPLKIIR